MVKEGMVLLVAHLGGELKIARPVTMIIRETINAQGMMLLVARLAIELGIARLVTIIIGETINAQSLFPHQFVSLVRIISGECRSYDEVVLLVTDYAFEGGLGLRRLGLRSVGGEGVRSHRWLGRRHVQHPGSDVLSEFVEGETISLLRDVLLPFIFELLAKRHGSLIYGVGGE